MRYSRMLEESSFANRKADYFWLLLLSSVMLLVSCINFSSPMHLNHHGTGHVSLIQPSISLLLACFRAHIYVVPSASIHANIALWVVHNLSAVSAIGPRDFFLGNKWNMEGGRGRSNWVCGRSHWMVPAGCLAKRDGRRVLGTD